jgi:RHS repeat-associated protein
LDFLGRVNWIQKKQSPTATNWDSVAYLYDSNGRQNKVTVPSSCPSGGCTTLPATTTTTYDALGRVLTITDPSTAQTNYTYTKNDVLITSPTPNINKQLEYNALGQLKSVCEITATGQNAGACGQANPQNGYLTTYAYSPLYLQTVTQNAQGTTQQTRSFGPYDGLGRMSSETNPEAGTVQYFYDSLGSDAACGSPSSAGDLVKRIDNASNATCFNYDGLHRVTSEGNTTVSGNTERYFVYDTASLSGTAMTNAVGRMSDLFDFPAREYHPGQGRWISPDPSGIAAVDLANPQSWNRYSYVEDNPLNRVDPLGLRDCLSLDKNGNSSVIPCPDPPPDTGDPSFNDSNATSWVSTGSSGCSINCGGLFAYVTLTPCLSGGGRQSGHGGHIRITTPRRFNPGKVAGPSSGPTTVNGTSNDPTQQCVSNFYNSKAGSAVKFGSPLATLPGWNPNFSDTAGEWAIAIFGKLGGLFGSGAMTGTTELTTLSGTKTVGSTLEVGTEATLGALEKFATPAMAVATATDIIAHGTCAIEQDPAAANAALQSFP